MAGQIQEVRRVFTHPNFHLDEAMTFFVARTLGGNAFPGIRDAEVVFADDIVPKTAAQWAAECVLTIGRGGGDFDEHKSGSEARIKGKSASVLMCERLTIDDQTMISMVREVNRFDGKPGCPKSHLGSLIKMAHANLPLGSDEILWKWSLKVLDVVYKNLGKEWSSREEPFPFQEFVTEVIDRQTFPDEDARLGLLHLIDVESRRESRLLFGLKHVYESLWRTAPGVTMREKRKAVSEDLRFALRMLYADQVNFHTFRRKMLSLSGKAYDETWFKTFIGDGTRETVVKCAIVVSDNPQAHNALRDIGAIITVVKSTKGNVIIQGNQGYAKTPWLRDAMMSGFHTLCAMNRFGDLSPENRNRYSWTLLETIGDCPVDGYWHLPDLAWMSVYNGTQTRFLPPTKITHDALLTNIRHAFSPKGLKNWKRFMHVPEIDLKPDNGGSRPLEVAMDSARQ